MCLLGARAHHLLCYSFQLRLGEERKGQFQMSFLAFISCSVFYKVSSIPFAIFWVCVILLLLSLTLHAKVVDALMKDIVPFSFSLHMLIQLNMYMAFTYFIMGHLRLECVQSPRTLLSPLGSSFPGVVC